MLPHKTHLRQKLSKKPSFRVQTQQSQAKYRSLLQRAIYSDLSSISSKFIVDAGRDQDNHKLFFIFGEQQPKKKKLIDKLYLFIINYLDQKIGDETFSIVYFNTCCQSYSNYSIFRTIYRTLPLKYFENLKRMIIVDPSFTVKAMEWFVSGTLNKVLHGLTVYIYKLKELKDYGIHFNKHRLALLPEYLNEDKQKEILRLSIRESIQLRMSKKLPQKRVKTKKLRLDQYETNEIGVPIALQMMISYFILHKEALRQQGLFRKSVVKSEIDQSMQFIKQKYYDFLQQITNPHIVANLITRFLGDLQFPLITFSIYQNLVHDNGRATQIPYLRQCFSTLPRQNKVTLLYFFDFLVQQIIPLKEYNKMTSFNLAVVLTPCLLRSGKELAIEELMYSKKLVIVMEVLIGKYQQVFGGREERGDIFRESVKEEKDKFLNEKVGRENGESSDEGEEDRQEEQKIQEKQIEEIQQKHNRQQYQQSEPIAQEQAVSHHFCFPVKIMQYAPDEQ